MSAIYHEIEARIQQAVEAIQSRPLPVNRNAVAREFDVPVQRLRSRLNGKPSKSEVRGMHRRALTVDQELALHRHVTRLDQLSIPARIKSIRATANTLLRQTASSSDPNPSVSKQWAKRWLDRQPDLFKAKRQPLAVARKNAHTPELMMKHFEGYKKMVEKNKIRPKDTWNFDETGYRMGVGRGDFVITTNPFQRVFSKDPDNRESLTAIEGINGVGESLPPMIILTGISLLEPYFVNDIDKDTLVTTSESGYSCDYLGLQWIKHFDKFSARGQEGEYRLLVMDGHGSHITKEFIEYCDEHKIIPFALPPHSTHLTQPLDVGVFQPLKHWHSEAINEAVQNGDETFGKLEFLATFRCFRDTAFKSTTILSAWRKVGLIPFNPSEVIDKIGGKNPAVRPTTPPDPMASPPPAPATPKTVRDIHDVANRIMSLKGIPEHLVLPLRSFTKGSVAAVRAGELAEARLDQSVAADNARKARRRLTNRVLQKGGVLYASEARAMTRERLELELKRELEREKRAEKKYGMQWKGLVRSGIAWKKKKIIEDNAYKKQWFKIHDELYRWHKNFGKEENRLLSPYEIRLGINDPTGQRPRK